MMAPGGQRGAPYHLCLTPSPPSQGSRSSGEILSPAAPQKWNAMSSGASFIISLSLTLIQEQISSTLTLTHFNSLPFTCRFGMHESYDYYQECKYRYRNKGLYTADQNMRHSARSTRQVGVTLIHIHTPPRHTHAVC